MSVRSLSHNNINIRGSFLKVKSIISPGHSSYEQNSRRSFQNVSERFQVLQFLCLYQENLANVGERYNKLQTEVRGSSMVSSTLLKLAFESV